MPYAKTSLRAEHRDVREKMRALGMGYRQVAVEFARRYGLRPRAAWRHAYGWSLSEAAGHINTYAASRGLDPDGHTVAMTGAHLCEHELWPGHAPKETGRKRDGRRPTPYLLSLLACVYQCDVPDLLDLADYEHMPPADRLVLDKNARAGGQRQPEPGARNRSDNDRSPWPAAATDPVTPHRPGSLVPAGSHLAEHGLASPGGYRLSDRGVTTSGDEVLAVNDPEVLTYLLNALDQHARIASTFGGRDLIPLIERHVSFIYSACGNARRNHRKRVLTTSARYAEFLGWLYQDNGHRRDALFWSDRALEWALEADDPLFASYVLMRKSDQAEETGVPGRVLDLALAAGRIPGLTPRARALVLQQEARGHAQDGNELLFQRRLEEAQECAAAASGSADAPWGMYCTRTYIAMQEATGWAELGQPGRALQIFERELPGMPAVDQVDAAVFRARLARTYAGDGQAGDAARCALGALPAACATGSARAFGELAHVREAVDGHRDVPDAARFISAFDSRVTRTVSDPGEQPA